MIGSRLVKGLADAGHRVRVLTLPGDPYVSRLDGLDVEIAYGDVSDASTLEGVFDGVDTVFHLAAILLNDNPAIFARVNAGGTRNLVEASTKAGVQHFIFCSSISVTYPYTTPYNASKREGERIVKEQGAMKWTIVRPTLAYNENGGEEYAMFIDFLKKYPVGSEVTGAVTSIADFGAFVKLEDGIEGLIYNSELSDQRVENASEVVKEGQEVTTLITKVDPLEQKISLSIRALTDKEQREALKKVAVQQATSQKTTFGDLLAGKLTEQSEDGEE